MDEESNEQSYTACRLYESGDLTRQQLEDRNLNCEEVGTTSDPRMRTAFAPPPSRSCRLESKYVAGEPETHFEQPLALCPHPSFPVPPSLPCLTHTKHSHSSDLIALLTAARAFGHLHDRDASDTAHTAVAL